MQENIAFVSFDFFGCGATGGEYDQMTYSRWRENLDHVFQWVKAQSFSCTSKIGCYAFSSGSTAALRFAAENPEISFVISVGTCISTHIGMNGGGPSKLLADNIDHLISGEKVDLYGTSFGIQFYIDTISKAPIHTMENIQCPVLFLQGTDDNPYRCADARMGYDLMKRKSLRAAYIEIAGGTHGLENMADVATASAFGWLLPLLNK